MTIMLNTLLLEAGLQLSDVRLIRHKDNSSKKGRTPYDLWHNNHEKFELYQSVQKTRNRTKMNAPFWVVFVVNQSNETMFAGLYAVNNLGLLEKDMPTPNKDSVDKAGSCDSYELIPQDAMSDLIGRLFIDWGSSALAWVQYPERNNKTVTRLNQV